MYSYNYKLYGYSILINSDVPDETLEMYNQISNCQITKAIYIKIKHDLDLYEEKKIFLLNRESDLKLVDYKTNSNFYKYEISDHQYMLLSNNGYEKSPHIITSKDNQIYEIVARQKSELSGRFAFHIIREIILRNLENSRGVLVHGASISLNNNAALVCGDSGAGKTTFISTLLLYLDNIEYISNDRSIVIPTNNNSYDILPYPLPLNLGLGAYRALAPDLNIDITNGRRKKEFSNMLKNMQESDWNKFEIVKENWGNKEKILLTTKEVKQAFNCNISPQANLRFILLPKLCMDNRELKLTQVSPRIVMDTVKGNLYTPNDPVLSQEWLSIRKGDNKDFIQQANDFLSYLEGIPIYQIECGIEFTQSIKNYSVYQQKLLELFH